MLYGEESGINSIVALFGVSGNFPYPQSDRSGASDGSGTEMTVSSEPEPN
jgi:hypothetical protein